MRHAALRLVLATWVALAMLLAPATARAATDVKASIDVDEIEVGALVHFSLQVMTTSTDLAFGDAELGAHAGFTVMGTTASPSQSISIVNGVTSQRRGVTVTWTLRGDRVGTLTVGPPSLRVGPQKVTGQSARVTVVQRGKLRRRPGGWDPSPFDPWKGLFDQGGGDDPFKVFEPDPETNPSLGLDAPRGAGTFLHATIDKTRAVVGEQVTHSVFKYAEVGSTEHDFNDVHEATAADFVKRSLLEGDREPRAMGLAKVAGRIYSVALVRKSALFPLKAGSLEIGPMSMALVHARGSGAVRESESLKVEVSDPRLKGRPAGFRPGDVGSFTLSSDVAPREVERGGAIAVRIELSGWGNLPASLAAPIRAGVEWLEPQVDEKVGALANDRFGGKRVFSFIVRMKKEGDIDLGALELPFYDPQRGAYDVARTALGTVRVTRSAVPREDAPADDALAGLPAPSATKEPISPGRARLTSSTGFWASLGAGPLAFVVARGAHAAATSLARRRKERDALPETVLRKKTGKIKDALASDDPTAALAAVENALLPAASLAAGIEVRGLPRDDLPAALEEGGVSGETAEEVKRLLAEQEEARFVPGGPAPGVAQDLAARARKVIRALEKARGDG